MAERDDCGASYVRTGIRMLSGRVRQLQFSFFGGSYVFYSILSYNKGWLKTKGIIHSVRLL